MGASVATAAQAAELIADKAVVSVSSSSGLGCPDSVLKAIGERFVAKGRPRDITTIHPIAAGDVYGIKGIDHLAHEGLLERVIAGSYPSGPSSAPMPAIWSMIADNRIAAYNIPSGVLFDMHRDVAARRAGVLTKVGMDTFVDPDQSGGAMNEKAAKCKIVSRCEFGGETWLHFSNIVPQVAILRATSADERGNLSFEHEGAFLGALDQAIAVRNHGGTVIAQVKRVVKSGSLRPQSVHVPGHLVDAIVVDAAQQQTTQTVYDPAISGEVSRPWADFAPVKHSIEKVLARRAAQELRGGQCANLGFGIAANIPHILLEEGYPEEVTWAIEQGAVGGVPLTGFAFGCASNAYGIIPSPNQFSYFQGGGFDITFLSFLEIDKKGNVNASKLRKRPYLTAGCGGFVDIVAHAKKIVFCGLFAAGAKYELDEEKITVTAPAKVQKMVDAVEQITFCGRRAREQNQEVLYVTERCVMKLDDDGLLATEIMPGMDVARDIIAASDNRVRVADRALMMDSSLLKKDRMGLVL